MSHSSLVIKFSLEQRRLPIRSANPNGYLVTRKVTDKALESWHRLFFI